MNRGIVVYLEAKRDLLLQFGCLYSSWKYIKAKKTDLIVFGSKEALKFVPQDCIRVEYTNKSFSNYPFIGSISCLASESAHFLEEYDYILRTDLDTFLTPSWNSFSPQHFNAGRGKYVHDEIVKQKLKGIAKKFGLRHRGIHNIGASHYGPPQMIRNICKLSLFLSSYILSNEFSISEGKWPSWYRGVTSMYSNEIAINHLVDDKIVISSKLDYDSSANDFVADHPHIHCWHTSKPFSKFEFSKGSYNNIASANLNVKKVNDYCIFVSLISIRDMNLIKSLLNNFD